MRGDDLRPDFTVLESAGTVEAETERPSAFRRAGSMVERGAHWLGDRIEDAGGWAANLVRYLPARNEVMHAYSDHSKSKKLFGDSLHTSLEDGLTKMATWAKKTGIQKSTTFKNIEITEKLPSFWTES